MAAKGGGGGGGQSSEGATDPIWIIVAIIAIGAVIWYTGRLYIVAAVFKIRLAEIALVSLFTERLAPTANWIHHISVSSVSFNELAQMSQQIGDYIAWPIALILLVLGFVGYYANSGLRFREVYSMKSLMDKELLNWPYISPVANLNLEAGELEKGPWAMAIKPMDFAKKNQLLIEIEEPPKEGVLRNKQVKRVEIDRAATRAVFSQQLGAYWKGVQALKPYERALCAVFAARVGRDRDSAERLLTQVSTSVRSGILDFTGTDELLRKHWKLKPVQTVLERHAFVLTVMAGLLEMARDDGVMASSEFLWLKPVDRRLWYMLNNVGRQTVFVEVAGPSAHFLVEKTYGRRLKMPMVDEAIKGFDDAVKEIIYKG